MRNLKMMMNKILLLFIFISLFKSFSFVYGQDTIKLEKKPKIILHSWYPEFREFPKLKIGNSTVLFTKNPLFEKLTIRDNDINLKTSNNQVKIEETEKINQYIITVNSTEAKYIGFEAWFDLDDKVILIKQKGRWKNIKELFPTRDNRILIDTIKIDLIK
jgi:hypothetical protein